MSGRTFLLAKNSPLRTTLIDEATGQAVYKVDTPTKFSASVTKIRKLDSPTQPTLHRNDDADSDSNEDIADKTGASGGIEEGDPMTGLPETSDEMARIYWKFISSDRIIFRGKITTQSDFLPAAGKLKGSFAFTGPDGIQYRWAMGSTGTNYPKLVTTDEKKTVLAEFHRAHYFTKRRKAKLEVQPAGMHMLDYIILTFLFVETKRREREGAAASSASSSAAAASVC